MTQPGTPDYGDIYDPDADFDRWYTEATGPLVASRLGAGQRVLELGCATGLMTVSLLAAGVTVVGVDRSDRYLCRARSRKLDGARFVAGDADAFDQGAPYDHLVAANLIHELPDPDGFLRRCHDRLTEGGLLHLTLQNPHSVHRLVALEMGLLSDLYELSARGRQFATRQLFGADQLVAMGERAGLVCVERLGVMLKPLPNDLMASLPARVLEGFVAVAPHFPRNCAMNYLVFRR